MEVADLPLPELSHESITLLQPLNGLSHKIIYGKHFLLPDWTTADRMNRALILEKSWGLDLETYCSSVASSISSSTSMTSIISQLEIFWQCLIEIEFEEELLYRAEGGAAPSLNNSRWTGAELIPLKVPMSEPLTVTVVMRNPLLNPLSITDLSLDLPSSSFEMTLQSVTIAAKSSVDVTLEAIPLKLGRFKLSAMKWTLKDGGVSVVQPIKKPAKLLQKTLHQRATRQTVEDKSLMFEVVPPSPSLHITLEGLAEEVLQGQIVKASVILKNEGAAPAIDIFIKVNQSEFVFYLLEGDEQSQTNSIYLPPWGQTGSLTKLPSGVTIPPGETFRLGAWIRLGKLGKQTISILASCSSQIPVDLASPMKGSEPRVTFTSLEVTLSK